MEEIDLDESFDDDEGVVSDEIVSTMEEGDVSLTDDDLDDVGMLADDYDFDEDDGDEDIFDDDTLDDEDYGDDF